MRGSFVYSAEGRLNTKLQRQRDLVKDLDKTMTPPPDSYRTNNSKEELCLEYVSNFVDQYQLIYKNRRVPYISADNEYGVKKLVCATLRPTLLPIPELYDMYECASFLAGFILYEPLEPQNEPPKYLFSPARVLESHTGDAFDLSFLLASFLLGAGYDAYVVMGYAPAYITLKDQSKTACPLIKDTEAVAAISATAAVDDNSFVPPDNTVKNSRFLAEIAEKKRLAAVDTFQLWIPDQPSDESKSEREGLDRLHAWVLVRAGRRDVKENMFIEPSTGRVCACKSAPYMGIEAVWNHLNFHVNSALTTAPSALEYDFTKDSAWEPLFIGKVDAEVVHVSAEDEHDLMGEHAPETLAAVNDDSLRLFDAPYRWSVPLSLPRSALLLKYPPNGKRSVQYYCCKVDFFARSVNAQAMVMRITTYLDANCTIVKEIYEWFENRSDHMFKRVRYFLHNRRFVEYYTPGSKGEVKKWTEYPGKVIEVDYYVNGRLDRLLRREETIGSCVTEHFTNRTDHMIYRSRMLTSERGPNGSRHFVLPDSNLTPEMYITRMTIAYERDTAVNDGSDIAKRIFYVREGKAVFYYHFAKGQISGKVKTFLHTRGPSIPALSDQALAQVNLHLVVLHDSGLTCLCRKSVWMKMLMHSRKQLLWRESRSPPSKLPSNCIRSSLKRVLKASSMLKRREPSSSVHWTVWMCLAEHSIAMRSHPCPRKPRELIILHHFCAAFPILLVFPRKMLWLFVRRAWMHSRHAWSNEQILSRPNSTRRTPSWARNKSSSNGLSAKGTSAQRNMRSTALRRCFAFRFWSRGCPPMRRQL